MKPWVFSNQLTIDSSINIKDVLHDAILFYVDENSCYVRCIMSAALIGHQVSNKLACLGIYNSDETIDTRFYKYWNPLWLAAFGLVNIQISL